MPYYMAKQQSLNSLSKNSESYENAFQQRKQHYKKVNCFYMPTFVEWYHFLYGISTQYHWLSRLDSLTITQHQDAQRLSWSKVNEQWDAEAWNEILFSNETITKLHSQWQFVRKPAGKGDNPHCTTKKKQNLRLRMWCFGDSYKNNNSRKLVKNWW